MQKISADRERERQKELKKQKDIEEAEKMKENQAKQAKAAEKKKEKEKRKEAKQIRDQENENENVRDTKKEEMKRSAQREKGQHNFFAFFCLRPVFAFFYFFRFKQIGETKQSNERAWIFWM